MCVYKYTCACRTCTSSLCYCSVSVWVCVCRGGKRENEEGTSTSNSLFGSLSVFDSERGSNRKGRGYHCRLPLSTQCVYTRGKNIVQRMWVQLWDRKDKGALWERKNCTSNSLLGFCSVIDPGCKSGEEECKEQIFTVAIHQAGFCLPLCVRAWGENNIKEGGSVLWNRKNVELEYGTERRTRLHYATEKWGCSTRQKGTVPLILHWLLLFDIDSTEKLRVHCQTER